MHTRNVKVRPDDGFEFKRGWAHCGRRDWFEHICLNTIATASVMMHRPVGWVEESFHYAKLRNDSGLSGDDEIG